MRIVIMGTGGLGGYFGGLLAGAGNDGQRKVIADRKVGDFYMFHMSYEDTCSRRTDAVSEIIR